MSVLQDEKPSVVVFALASSASVFETPQPRGELVEVER
jgi:hypothetical protein